MPDIAVGQQLELVKGPVTTTQLVMYAGASGDFNRIHYDLPYALDAGLGGVIAHGMLTMAFAAQMVTEFGGSGCFVSEIDARFLAPVVPGDLVHLHGRVTATSKVGNLHCADVEFRGLVDQREVIAGTGSVMIPSR